MQALQLRAALAAALLLAACGDNGAKTTVSPGEDTAVEETADTELDDTADTELDNTTDTNVDDTADTNVEETTDTAAEETTVDDTTVDDTAIEDTTDTNVEETTDTTVEDTTVDTTPPPFPSCPRFSAAARAGLVTNPDIVEASGLAASRRNANVLWVHNDRGDTSRVFAISTTGASLATFVLAGAEASDWEDIAVGPGPIAGASYLYVGDIGDNSANSDTIEVYRVAEPAVTASSAEVTLSGVDRLEFRYPGGQGDNAETLLVDPTNGDLYVVTKSDTGEARVYRASPPFVPLRRTTMTLVTTLQFGSAPLLGDASATGGDISPNGELIAIRSYDTAYAWRRPAGTTVEEALATPPCSLPVRAEAQGEAFGFFSDGTGYFTVSEGTNEQLSRYVAR
jgi:hypothetical protein